MAGVDGRDDLGVVDALELPPGAAKPAQQRRRSGCVRPPNWTCVPVAAGSAGKQRFGAAAVRVDLPDRVDGLRGTPDGELGDSPVGQGNGRSHIERHGLAVTRIKEHCKEGHEPQLEAAAHTPFIIEAGPSS